MKSIAVFLLLLLVFEISLSCIDVPKRELVNFLRETTCELKKNDTAFDLFKDRVIEKHGGSSNSTVNTFSVTPFSDFIPETLTDCPQETVNVTWCLNIFALEMDIEICIFKPEYGNMYTNATCEADILGISDTLSVSSSDGCLTLSNVDKYYDGAILTLIMETEYNISFSFYEIKTNIVIISNLERFSSSPVGAVEGGTLILSAEIYYPDTRDSSVSYSWHHKENSYRNFTHQDPLCLSVLKDCQIDSMSEAATMEEGRIRAYQYPDIEQMNECVYVLKNYLIIENATLQDSGLYVFERTSTLPPAPFALVLSTTNNFTVSITPTTITGHDLTSSSIIATSIGGQVDATSNSDQVGQPTQSSSHPVFTQINPSNGDNPEKKQESGGISKGSAAAIGVAVVVAVVIILSTLGFILLCVKRKQKCTSIRYSMKNKAKKASRELPEIPTSSHTTTGPLEQLKQEFLAKDMLFSKHNIQLGKIIGEGTFGLVYRAYINNGLPVAIKSSKMLSSQHDKDTLLKEVSIMLSFNHPNVMSLIGICFDGEALLLIMPYMSGGSILNYVKENRDTLYIIDDENDMNVLKAQKKCLDMCYQIAKGMNYLATQHFVHRDLAARNCMIDGLSHDGVVKVADFGLTEDMYGTNYYRRKESLGEERVPIRWMPPESIENNIYDESSDVWSFGVTCWEVFTCGAVPYTGIPVMTLLAELNSGHRLERPRNQNCSDQIWSILEQCWYSEPQRRPRFNDLVTQFFNLLDSIDPSYLILQPAIRTD